MASTRKLPSGRFQGRAKQGRVLLGTQTFDRKRDALAWAQRLEEMASSGLSVTAGKRTVRQTLPEWLEVRRATVTASTYEADAALLAALSPAILKKAMSAVTPADVSAWLAAFLGSRSYGTVKRRKESLNSFFAWAIEDGRIPRNPAHAAKMPRRQSVIDEMHPFDEDELQEVLAELRATSPYYAAVAEVLARTGLRWGEARSLRVGDLRRSPVPAFRVRRSQSEGRAEKTTKGAMNRTVPLPDDVLALVERLIAGKDSNAYVFTGERGGQLWASRFKDGSGWPDLARGRRIHDLRHTAASLWLAQGIPTRVVQEWLGHSDIATTNRYSHHLGLSADRAALDLLNRRTTGE